MFINATTICQANVPSPGFVSISSVNESTYSANSVNAYRIQKAAVLDAAFFNVEVRAGVKVAA